MPAAACKNETPPSADMYWIPGIICHLLTVHPILATVHPKAIASAVLL